MKKLIIYSLLMLPLVVFWACKKGNYPGDVVSDYIGMFDVRAIYKGQDVVLTKHNMFGATKIAGVVVSDHSGNNLPPGLLILEDQRRLSKIRGISVAIGDAAATYKPGDSVEIHVEGSTLTQVNGVLQITNITNDAVQKVASGRNIPINWIYLDDVVKSPDDYESTLSIIVKANIIPLPATGEVLAGDKIVDDTYEKITMHTEAKAGFTNAEAPLYANFYGIIFNFTNSQGVRVPQFRLRTGNDVVKKNNITKETPALITGFMSDAAGGDGDYEYVQFLATKDIDFAVTPMSLVTTNNAGTSTPIGFPLANWATGGVRTYKINITTGKANKGTFFYVGGTKKLINGAGSTDIKTSNWVKAYAYSGAGEGFGTGTSGLFANSGNAFGMAIFEGTNITAASFPFDVVFIGTGGTLTGDGRGYPVADNDYYDTRHPVTNDEQFFYQSGSNKSAFAYQTADLGIFNKLVGEYNTTLNRWTKVRQQVLDTLDKASPVTVIESGSTILKN